MKSPETLVSQLVGHLEKNGLQPGPTLAQAEVYERWEEDARALCSEHPEREIDEVLAWAMGRDFWRARITTMPKLRHNYPQLRLEAETTGALTPEEPQSLGSSEIERRVARYRRNITGGEVDGDQFLEPEEVDRLCAEERARLRQLQPTNEQPRGWNRVTPQRGR